MCLLIGILVERRVCCPLCNSPSFVGEWQQPKQLQTELQDNLQRKCEACKEMVETDYLIQPRGQKTGIYHLFICLFVFGMVISAIFHKSFKLIASFHSLIFPKK